MNSQHLLTAAIGFGDERLVSHVEARRQQRALERSIDGPFNPGVSLMLDRLNSMSITTSTGEERRCTG
jgi:hypothetical protein